MLNLGTVLLKIMGTLGKDPNTTLSLKEALSYNSICRSLSMGKEAQFCVPRAITEAARFGVENGYLAESVLLKNTNTKSLEAAEEAAKNSHLQQTLQET